MDYELNKKDYLEKHGFEAFTPKAVLFDMDGVIYDSMPAHAQAWNEVMTKFGLDFTPEEVYQYEGMRGVEVIRFLVDRQWHREITDEEAEEMYAAKSRYFSQFPPAPKMPGIETLMQQIKACGLKIGVVTGSGQLSLLDQLEAVFPNLLCRELVVTSFDVEHGKPDPEPYIKGMQKAGVQPWETIVVENAPLGVRAAVAARAFTIAVNTGPLPDEHLAAEGASLIFPRMTALSEEWPNLINKLTQ